MRAGFCVLQGKEELCVQSFQGSKAAGVVLSLCLVLFFA